jgi:hypothetical protein
MGRPRKNPESKKLSAGGTYDHRLVTAFGYLCRQMGVSNAEGIRRLLVEAVKQKRIPGVSIMDYEEVNANMPFNSAESDVLYESKE